MNISVVILASTFYTVSKFQMLAWEVPTTYYTRLETASPRNSGSGCANVRNLEEM